jgi:DNA-3-methyladenine glycosylase II
MSYRKASYVLGAAQKAASGELDIEALYDMTDEEILKSLTSLNGIGIWTAEMLMLFSMGRMDIFSYGDLAIHRGLKIIYRHRKVPRELFEKYRRRYSPYGSVASLYIWAAAGGALEQIAELP